jgi:hypothetical protein
MVNVAPWGRALHPGAAPPSCRVDRVAWCRAPIPWQDVWLDRALAGSGGSGASRRAPHRRIRRPLTRASGCAPPSSRVRSSSTCRGCPVQVAHFGRLRTSALRAPSRAAIISAPIHGMKLRSTSRPPPPGGVPQARRGGSPRVSAARRFRSSCRGFPCRPRSPRTRSFRPYIDESGLVSPKGLGLAMWDLEPAMRAALGDRPRRLACESSIESRREAGTLEGERSAYRIGRRIGRRFGWEPTNGRHERPFRELARCPSSAAP